MNKSEIHPELHQLVDEQSKNQVALWVYPFLGNPILIFLDWWGLDMTLESRILYYAVVPALLLAFVYGHHLSDKRRFRRLSWLLYQVKPVRAIVCLRLHADNEYLQYEATIEPVAYAYSVIQAQKIIVDIPEWDSSAMVDRQMEAECYVRPDSRHCEIIRTEKGLLIER
jgi:hypothetical protein